MLAVSLNGAGVMRSIFACRVRRGRVLVALSLVSAAACGADSITLTDRRSASYTVDKGTQLTIELGTVGSGSYQSPPSVSSPSVEFLGESPGPVAVPSGPIQEFRFKAVSAGRAVIVFQHTGSNPTVTDTIIVR